MVKNKNKRTSASQPSASQTAAGTHLTSVYGPRRREASAAGSVEVGRLSVDERRLLPRLVLGAPGIAEFRPEAREEAGFLWRFRLL